MRPLEVLVEGGLPTIEVDPVLFRRVFDNLLENAHKYSPDPAEFPPGFASPRLSAWRLRSHWNHLFPVAQTSRRELLTMVRPARVY